MTTLGGKKHIQKSTQYEKQEMCKTFLNLIWLRCVCMCVCKSNAKLIWKNIFGFFMKSLNTKLWDY